MEYFQSSEMFRTIVGRYFANQPPAFVKQVKATKAKPAKAPKPEGEAKAAEPMPTDPAELLKFKRDYHRSYPAAYDPDFVESNWYKWWETNKYFHETAKEGLSVEPAKRFVMILPPPNVTGMLHAGHALTGAIEDCMSRWRKMSGYKTVYVPGVDHAGIATQSVVEKTLAREGVNKNTLGREKFVERVWEWKNSYGTAIEHQLRRLGTMLDWDRFSFTMDNDRSLAVKEAFVRLHEKGLIYRANRLVNWSCSLKTAISDIEVETLEVPGPTMVKTPSDPTPAEVGVLIEFAYKVKDSDEEIVVATTRLETMLGDVAVAVNSNDPRYTHLIGKELVHPFIPDRHMKVVTDDILVDMAFGTGAVKITPAHDPNDFECGKRNNLHFINILNDDGSLNSNAGPYAGQPRYTARKQMEADMTKMGLIRGKKPNPMALSICSRSQDIIEPIMKPQWYQDCKDIAQRMIQAVEQGELRIVPDYRAKIWYTWLSNIQDWCISRQLWWGHRIPAYRALKNDTSDHFLSNPEGAHVWIVARSDQEAKTKFEAAHPHLAGQYTLVQDEDVLDTWFSSALLPFSNFGWPNTDNPDFQAFFPNTILETGHDILFFWVARMVMMSLLLTDQLPFRTVYLHNIIRDENGEKMSKSKGNVIDPMDIIDGCPLQRILDTVSKSLLSDAEKTQTLASKKKKFPEGIPKCGADALRFALLSYVSEIKDINLDVRTIMTFRLFCNKIWNGYKLCRNIVGDDLTPEAHPAGFASYPAPEKWILSRFDDCARQMNELLEAHKYADATEAFTAFFYTLCDHYLEYAKTVDKSNVELMDYTRKALFHVLSGTLRLLHPLMPFLSEELYQKLPVFPGKKETIMWESYPTYSGLFEHDQGVRDFDLVLKAILSVRQLTGVFNLPANASPPLFITGSEATASEAEAVFRYARFLQIQTKTGEIRFVAEKEVPTQCLKGIINANVSVHLHLKDTVKLGEEKLKVTNELNKVIEHVAKMKSKIARADYQAKASEEVKAREAEAIANYDLQIKKLTDTLALIESMS